MAKVKEKLVIPPAFAIGQVTNVEEFMVKLCPHHGLTGKVFHWSESRSILVTILATISSSICHPQPQNCHQDFFIAKHGPMKRPEKDAS